MRPIFEPCENWHYYQKNKCHYDCLWSRNRIINKRPDPITAPLPVLPVTPLPDPLLHKRPDPITAQSNHKQKT